MATRLSLWTNVRLLLDVLKRRPELAPEGLVLAVTAIDTLERRSGTGPVNFRVGVSNHIVRSRRFHASILRRTISTFLLRHRTPSIPRLCES